MPCRKGRINWKILRKEIAPIPPEDEFSTGPIAAKNSLKITENQ